MASRTRLSRSYLCDDSEMLFIPGLSLDRIGVNHGGQLDRAPCPMCGAPLTARIDRHGPYFHCLCPPRSLAARRLLDQPAQHEHGHAGAGDGQHLAQVEVVADIAGHRDRQEHESHELQRAAEAV